MKLTEVNINDHVRVILTPEGKCMCPERVRHTDRVVINGQEHLRTEFQLHELMAVFGSGCSMGLDRHLFFENRIWFETKEK